MRRFAAVALFCLTACRTPPVPVPPIPPWDEVRGPAAPIDYDERQLWTQAAEDRADLAKRGLVVSDDQLDGYLATVLVRLTPQSLPDDVPKPAVSVIRDAMRIAMTLPDGRILVTTSMLATMENEAQLAGLLGHELGHFVGRHRFVQIRYARSSRSTVERMELARAQETYCDRYALSAMRRAGYDARELPRMLTLTAADDDKEPPSAARFRSHPFTRQRIDDLNAAIGNAPDGTPRVGKDEYEQAIAGVLPVAAKEELEARELDHAKQSIARLLMLRPDDGRAYYLKGEHARLTERDGRHSAPARAAYERAVELAPNDPDAVRALGLLYEEDGNTARATALLQKYLSLVPDASDRRLVERYLGRESH